MVDKPAATTEHAKKLAARTPIPCRVLLRLTPVRIDSGHKRALSNCEGPKPWELEQQLKEKAHERASVALERHRSASGMLSISFLKNLNLSGQCSDARTAKRSRRVAAQAALRDAAAVVQAEGEEENRGWSQ